LRSLFERRLHARISRDNEAKFGMLESAIAMLRAAAEG
jgi:hypothetical protein